MIAIENLRKKFGHLSAVDGLSMEIHDREIVGLLGPNGAGKTTSINMICGLLPPTGGSIRFEGYAEKDVRSIIGYCPQENIYYPKLSCYEQVVFQGMMYVNDSRLIKSRASAFLEQFGLADKARERAGTLSGGMKRRLNICLALVHNPEVLVLDEPEAGLDPQSRIMVRDFIKAYGKEKPVILSTHNMDEADRLADRVAIIDHGKLLLLDTPQNLKKTVGEGDILELVFGDGSESAIRQLAADLAAVSPGIWQDASSLLIKKANVLAELPNIKRAAESAGLSISEFRLRENTLEDVFISLTGRNLRS